MPDVVLIQLVILMSLTQACTPNDHLHSDIPDVVLIQLALLLSLIQTCTPNDHPNRVPYTRCRIDTISSPDESQPNLHTKRSSTESDIYQMLY